MMVAIFTVQTLTGQVVDMTTSAEWAEHMASALDRVFVRRVTRQEKLGVLTKLSTESRALAAAIRTDCDDVSRTVYRERLRKVEAMIRGITDHALVDPTTLINE